MASIFLSHSSVDKEFTKELHKILKQNGIESWIDEAEIKIGDSLLQKISEGIKKADYVAIILSPHSMKSHWVERELEMAVNQEIEQGKTKVLPILIENCEIPEYIKTKKYGDFRTSSKTISGIQELLQILNGKAKEKRKPSNYNLNTKKININKLKAITQYANDDYSGMGLSKTAAANFGIEWSQKYTSYNFEKFKELFQYANDDYSGLGLSPTDSKDWALKVLKESE